MSIITTPFAWLLLQLYYLLNNYEFALIALALLIAIIRIPFDYRTKMSGMRMSLLNPQLAKLKERHGENTPKYNEEVQKLYKQEGVNPLSGCLWSIIPMLIVFIIYQVVRRPLTYTMGLSNEQINLIAETLNNLGTSIDVSGTWHEMNIAQNILKYFDEIKAVVPEVIKLDFSLFGVQLSRVPSFQFWRFADWDAADRVLLFLPIVSAGVSFASQRLTTAMSFQQQQQEQSGMGGMMKNMMLISPLFSVWIGYTFPIAISIYWLASNFFTMVATFFVNRTVKSKFDIMSREREEAEAAREAELEAKRAETERLKAQGATRENPNTSKKNKKRVEKKKEEERMATERKKERPPRDSDENPSREGNRPYARGRAYDPDRFDGSCGADSPERNVQNTPIPDAAECENTPEPQTRDTDNIDPWTKQPKPGVVDAILEHESEDEYEDDYEDDDEDEDQPINE